jgi:molybdate transport system ATP-binding protein
LTVVLRDIRLPLAHFTLEVSAEIGAAATALYGPSGAGKTSLLEIIAGIRRPTEGSVILNGRDVTAVRPQHRHIGYVPQDDALFPHMSVRRNILYGGNDARFTMERVVGVLEIAHLLDRGIVALSGGERKRVALARALLSGPEILLLDEPLSGVDPELRKRVIEYLMRVREEFPIPLIYVTHELEEAKRICDVTMMMREGRISVR